MLSSHLIDSFRNDRPQDFHVAPNLEIDFYENICQSKDHSRVARRVNESKNSEKFFEMTNELTNRRTTIPIKEMNEFKKFNPFFLINFFF